MVPRLVYTSKEELTDEIKLFCEKHNLQLNSNNSGDDDDSDTNKATNGEWGEKEVNIVNGGNKIGDNQKEASLKKKRSIRELHLGEDISVDDAAIYQFINLLSEISLCDELIPLIADDLQIYQLW